MTDRVNPSAYSLAVPQTTDEIRAYVDALRQALNDVDQHGTIGSQLAVQDEGVDLATGARGINFTGPGVTVSGTGTIKNVNVPSAAVGGLPWLNIDDFGAAGNGTTDDATAVRNCVAALPTAGGTIQMNPAKYYRINSNVDCSAKDGIIFRGAALPFWQSSTGSTPNNTGSKFVIANGITGFLNDGGGTTSVDQRGIEFDHVGFETVSPLTKTGIAVKVDRTNRWRFVRCHFSGFGSAVQIDSHVTGDSPNNDNAWSVFDDCHFLFNAKSVETIHTYGFTIFGGSIVQSAGQTGLYLPNGEHVRVFGMKFDNGTGIDYRSGFYGRVIGCSFERCDIGLRVGIDARGGFTDADPGQVADSRFFSAIANSFSGTGSSDGKTAIVLSTHARGGFFAGNTYSNIQTKVTDTSHGGHTWHGVLPTAGDVGIALPSISTPATGASGEIVNVSGVLKIYNGSAWVSVGAQT